MGITLAAFQMKMKECYNSDYPQIMLVYLQCRQRYDQMGKCAHLAISQLVQLQDQSSFLSIANQIIPSSICKVVQIEPKLPCLCEQQMAFLGHTIGKLKAIMHPVECIQEFAIGRSANLNVVNSYSFLLSVSTCISSNSEIYHSNLQCGFSASFADCPVLTKQMPSQSNSCSTQGFSFSWQQLNDKLPKNKNNKKKSSLLHNMSLHCNYFFCVAKKSHKLYLLAFETGK